MTNVRLEHSSSGAPAPRTGGGVRVALGALALAALVATAPAALRAQGSTRLGIYGGVFTPLGSDLDLGAVGGQVKRQNSLAVGARLTFWGPGILGVEAVGGYSPAKTKVAGGTVNSSRNLNLFVGGLKLLVGISPAMSPIGFQFSAGPAVIRRGHDVTSQDNSETKFGGVFGAGVRFPIGSAVSLTVDGEDYIYKSTIGTNEETRNDLILSAGLSFGF